MIFLNFSLNLGKGTTYRASAVNALTNGEKESASFSVITQSLRVRERETERKREKERDGFVVVVVFGFGFGDSGGGQGDERSSDES
jgi:hypothetical protein